MAKRRMTDYGKGRIGRLLMNRKDKRRKTESPSAKTAWYGLLIALAMIFGYVETLVPIHLGIPGVKLGLANLGTVVSLYTVGWPGTLLVNGVRILLTGILFGNTFSIAYSLAGAALSMLMMAICIRGGWFTMVGVSVIGGVAHNVGQLGIAAYVVHTMGVFSYLPVLLAAGTAAGALIGLLGGMVIRRIKRVIPHMGQISRKL